MKYTIHFITVLLLLSGCKEGSPHSQSASEDHGQDVQQYEIAAEVNRPAYHFDLVPKEDAEEVAQGVFLVGWIRVSLSEDGSDVQTITVEMDEPYIYWVQWGLKKEDVTPSVMQHGILSHERTQRLPHRSVAMEELQERRHRKMVPGGLRLHQYANLYFCARNPMLYKRQNERDGICVLRINRKVLMLDNVVLTDQNAGSDYVRFLPSPAGLRLINFDWVFLNDWNDPDQIQKWKKSSAKCAEVLVPNVLPVEYIEGAYVANETAQTALEQTGFDKAIMINAELFFL